MFGVRKLLLFTGDGVGSCSMDCDYCFLAKRGALKVMTKETLLDAIEFLERLTSDASLHFFGAEPTMQWTLVQEARLLRPNMNISLTTNGYLLTPDRIDWMADNDVRVYVYSIDGGKEHNKHRKDANGNETWDKVASNLSYLTKTQGDWVTARVTWTPDNYDLLGRFIALEKIGARSIQVVPDVDHGVEWDEDKVQDAYLEVGKYYNWRRTPSRYINEMVQSIAQDKRKPGYPCNFGHASWAVMPDGELRACQRGEVIGNIYDGITDVLPLYESRLCAEVVNSRLPMKQECSECVAFSRCPGVGYCSGANRECGNSAIPTGGHCQHLRGMVKACQEWANHIKSTMPNKYEGRVIVGSVLGGDWI